MGSVHAKCKCSYEAEVFLGAVRSNYLESFKFPHTCQDCSKVVTVQMCCENPVCPSCGGTNLTSLGYEMPKQSTGVPGLIEKGLSKLRQDKTAASESREGRTLSETWNFCSQRSWALTEGPHACPSCEEKSMFLSLGALYD